MTDHVKINGINYDIRKQKVIRDNGREYYGMIEYSKALIRIKDGMHPDFERISLWHEIMHGICYEHNIQFPDEDRERIIDALARGVAAVLRDNPWLGKHPD